MKWCVVRTGIRQFDMLHAYGLGVLLATACETTVRLEEAAYSYILSCPAVVLPQIESDALLEHVFPLPGEEELRLCNLRAPEQKLSITVLDGLLAALFTTPGSRALSVSDLLRKQSLDQTAIQKGLLKATKKIGKWKMFARQVAQSRRINWLDDVLRAYHPTHPICPILVEGTSESAINVLMTIDPSLSYSLRGHRLSGDLVNYYLPVARSCSIHAHTTLPLLLPTDQNPEQATLRQWLLLSQQTFQGEAAWSSLAYQTLLTQGLQQSLSLEHGDLEYAWLFSLRSCLGNGLLRFWQFRLSTKGGAPEEQEDLLNCLKWRNPRSWLSHLIVKARTLVAHPDSVERRYSLEEVRIITEAMKNSEQESLKIVLEREEGTRRFGRVLRQIGRSNPTKLRELIEELETAHTRAQLLPALHRIVLASELEKAKEPRIIVPAERDMTVLLEDVDRFGLPEVVGLLLVLSVLHYSRRDENGGRKVEVSTLIRALSLLVRYLEAISAGQSDTASPSPELFLDDPERTGEAQETQEEE